jgi:hypothetical protein
MPRAKPKPDKKQGQRFVDAARELECDESGKMFEQTFKALVPPKRATKKRR